MRTDLFDYELPTGSIAQSPTHPRDACRLMVFDRASGQIDHRIFRDITDYLRPTDLVVVNETRVLPARLVGTKEDTGGSVEVLLLREVSENTWECLVKPGRRVRAGARLTFGEGELTALVLDVIEQTGGRLVLFRPQGESLRRALHRLGEVPLPPYITRPLEDAEDYQTVFARDERSAAAPTAGLHFTPELLERVRAACAGVVNVELDVGLDTFRPVSEDDASEHTIHTEHFRVPEATAQAVNETKRRGGRIVAIGTTSVRALESAFDEDADEVVASEGATSLYILPGYSFRVVDALVTNFHVPRSTLLMLVSAFAGRENVLAAYDLALAEGYRFLSFGDAMLIV